MAQLWVKGSCPSMLRWLPIVRGCVSAPSQRCAQTATHPLNASCTKLPDRHTALADPDGPAHRLGAAGYRHVLAGLPRHRSGLGHHAGACRAHAGQLRSEEHTSELQSLMRISYAVFCLKKKKKNLTAKIHQ